jgi:cyclic-di-GMP-binding protein
MPGTKLTRTAEVYPGEVQRTKIVESRSTPRLSHEWAEQFHRIGIERHPKLSSALALDRMATQCSFDVTSNVDLQEVDNALNQARKEVAQRYDFKGSKASIDFSEKELKLVLVADDEFKLNALWEIVSTRLVRRNVPVKNLTRGPAQPAANSTVRQEVALQQGIPTEKARDIVKFIKDSKLKKVQAAIQGDQLRLSSASKDDLQEVMRLLREQDFGVALQFGNYRG